MNTIVREPTGYDFEKELEKAQTRLAYHTEGLFVTVATAIIGVMEDQGITKSELADRCKVTPSYITRILRGHTNLSLESLAKIAFALGMQWECALLPMATGEKSNES